MTTKRRPATQCTHKRQCTSKECRDCKEGLGSNDHFTAKPKKAREPRIPMTPLEFNQLPMTSKIHQLVLVYMAVCTAEGFSKKSLFPLTRYFANKVDPVHYQCFFDYLSSLSEPTEVSLYELYALSTQHQLNLRLNAGWTVDVPEYQSLLSCLNGL